MIAYLGIRASLVPFLLPKPRCLPMRLAAVRARARARECIVTGLRMMRPSETSLRMVWRELALEISLTSLGSSQILRFPQPTTEAARRFCVRRLTLLDIERQYTGVAGVLGAVVRVCAKRSLATLGVPKDSPVRRERRLEVRNWCAGEGG